MSDKIELSELEKDKARLDWCERNLIALIDTGGAYIIEFGFIGDPTKLDNEQIPSCRAAIDLGMSHSKPTS